MSDSIRDDDLTVDPRLDALLGRALGRGAVSRQQRQRHLERLGLAPRLGGSAGQWRAPVVAGRPPSSTASQPGARPVRRRRRQWLELGAAVLAVVLVGSLLVALFRDWSGAEDDQQLAASPEATSPQATATPRETREQLYVVSHVSTRAQDAILLEGRVSAIDPQTGEEYWSVEAGPRIDSVLSPDGQRLFVADSGLDGDHLYALDTRTGRELWREPIEDRQWHKPGAGQSMLSVSPDGATVSVYACEGCAGEIRSTAGRNWLAQFDAVTGNRQPDLEIPACRGVAWLAPERPGTLPVYVSCAKSPRMVIINLADGQPIELTYDAALERPFPEMAGANAAAISPDGLLLYLVSGNRLTVIDMTQQAAQRILLGDDINVELRLPLLALSPDGTRMFVGSLDTAAFDEGQAEVNRVDVYETATFEPIGQITPRTPLTSTAFAAAPDGDGVYGVSVNHLMSDDVNVESTIQRLALDGEATAVATRTNEEVLYLFAGTVDVDSNATPLPTPTPESTAHERLFAVSEFAGAGGDGTGRVTAYDAETGSLVYRIDTAINPDAVLSPDGTRLYIVSGGVISSGGTSETTLEAVEATSGDKLWSVDVAIRIPWVRGAGPTTLAVSSDGSRLFAYSNGESDGYTIQVYDTENGEHVGTVEDVTGCTAQLFPSADGRSLYVVCQAERFAPQVIDLETMTSAGVMQGFGGVISGAAASPDGRFLYIPQDIDTEMSLSVIDMNGRVIADMRSIIHLARDPLHSLNITAVSPDGARLFIGVGSQPEGEAPVANEVWVWDTAMLHSDTIRLPAPEPINGWSLAPGPDNRSVFAVHNDDGFDAGGQPSQEAVIMRLSVDDGSDEFVRYWGGDILRVFSGRVTDAPELPATDEPQRNLRDLEVPDGLPLGLTFSHYVWTGATSGQFIFTGDDNLGIQIAVRPWEDGDVLDPPAGSTPVQLGNLTVYVTPDPEGGWPRLAAWHDPRWAFHLTVLSGPTDGWTQDALLALVAAFSSPASASVCPTTPWPGLENRTAVGLPETHWIGGDGLALGNFGGILVEGENPLAWLVDSPGIVDPDPDARIALRGTRLGTGYERSIALEQRDFAIDYNVMVDGGVQHHVRSTVIFPTFGCWQIDAEFGGHAIQAVVNVGAAYSLRSPAQVWGYLRWRPLHELGSDATPPCLRMPAQQVISDFGPLVGDVQINAGPAYLNGPDVEGVIPIASEAVEEGGHYARVMFVTSGDYSGPLLVRAAPGSGPIAFSTFGPDPNPMSELRLADPAGTSQTEGVRHWIVYLRLAGPGCHTLQIDGLDFSSTIVFEAISDEALNVPDLPAWDGSLYALSHEEGNSGVVELDGLTGEVVRRIDLTLYGNSDPYLVVNAAADRLAVTASLPGEEQRLDVLIYRLSDFTLLQRVPVPTLIQSFGIGDGLALSPDGRFLHAYQYETPSDGNGDNARYWLGTYDLESQAWLADIELPGCGMVSALNVISSPYVYVQCERTGLLNVDTASGTVERIDDGQQTASFQHHGNKFLLLTTDGVFSSGAYWPSVGGQNARQVALPDGWRVMELPFHASGGFHRLYLPIAPLDDDDATEIAVVDLSTLAVSRRIRTSTPLREVVFAGDEQFAYVTLTDNDGFTTGIARIDLATGAETLLVEGFFGNLVAVADGGS